MLSSLMSLIVLVSVSVFGVGLFLVMSCRWFGWIVVFICWLFCSCVKCEDVSG